MTGPMRQRARWRLAVTTVVVVVAACFAAVNPYSVTDDASAAPSAPRRADAKSPTGDATFAGQMPAASAAPATRTAAGPAAMTIADELPAGTPGPVVSAVVRDRDVMDIFGVDAGQRIYTAAWKPDHTDGWHRWAQLNGGIAAPGTSVYGVSRQTDQLDIFAVGTDHKVYSAAWNPSNGTQWAGWWRIGDLTVAPNTSVHAVTSVSQNEIYIFAVGSDRKVYTASWRPSTGWVAWTRLDGTTVRANTTVFGVYRSGGYLDIFAVDTNADVAWARFLPGAGGGWQPWQALGMGSWTVTAGSGVFPVSRAPNKIDIFTVARSTGFLINDVITSSWDLRANGDRWSALSRVGDARPRSGSTVFAAHRRTDFIDVFAVRGDGKVITASSDNGAPYQGWWQVGTMTAAPGTSVFGTVRDRDHLDVFGIDANTGTYTAAWEPGPSGWRGWWEVGPQGQAGTYLLSTANINLNGGVSGSSTLRISSGGAWQFRGRLHNSGVPSYIVGLVWTVSVPSGKVFTFKIGADLASLAHPDDADGRTKEWSEQGASNDLAQYWNEIQSSGTWSWRARSDVDPSDLVWETVTALGYIAKVVVIISLF
jgi:hypothetical protein